MKNIFYGLCSFIIVTFLLGIATDGEPQLNVNEYVGCVIIDKQTSMLDGNGFELINEQDSIIGIDVRDYVYNKYDVGDTIKYEDRWNNVH